MDETPPIGEVIESSTQQFSVACHNLFEAPAFGSLVKAATLGQPRWVYGVVYDVATGSEPPGAAVTVRGSAERRDGEIYRSFPDLKEIMRTRFTALTVGFADDGDVHQYLPPQPPPLHYSVYVCNGDDVRSFSEKPDYLRTILTNRMIPADELAAASVRLARSCRPLDPTYALRTGRLLALLLKEEYDRLRAILARIGV